MWRVDATGCEAILHLTFVRILNPWCVTAILQQKLRYSFTEVFNLKRHVFRNNTEPSGQWNGDQGPKQILFKTRAAPVLLGSPIPLLLGGSPVTLVLFKGGRMGLTPAPRLRTLVLGHRQQRGQAPSARVVNPVTPDDEPAILLGAASPCKAPPPTRPAAPRGCAL